jgi:hypothetical protein
MKSFIIALAMFAIVVRAKQSAVAQQNSPILGNDSSGSVFGPANSRPNLGTNGPGRAGNLPAPGGSLNGNSAFHVMTSPFAQNSIAGIVGPSINVAMPTPPGLTLDQQIPTYYPLYLPDGSMNQYVGPGAPIANGPVMAGEMAALTQAAQENAARQGMVFQNGQWWNQSPAGNWEYYRDNRWNAYPAGAGTTPSTSAPSIMLTGNVPAPMRTSATPTYTYEVPPYYSP